MLCRLKKWFYLQAGWTSIYPKNTEMPSFKMGCFHLRYWMKKRTKIKLFIIKYMSVLIIICKFNRYLIFPVSSPLWVKIYSKLWTSRLSNIPFRLRMHSPIEEVSNRMYWAIQINCRKDLWVKIYSKLFSQSSLDRPPVVGGNTWIDTATDTAHHSSLFRVIGSKSCKPVLPLATTMVP